MNKRARAAMDSVLLIGQSNMAGRGIIGSVEPIPPRGMLFMLRNGRWQPMSEPINPDRQVFAEKETDFRSGISLAASFADSYASTYGRRVGLIPCAEGGSAVSEWQPGGVLLDHAAMQAELAQRSSHIVGILWHQGESDSKTIADVRAYKERFFTMLDALTARLGLDERTPVILGEVCEALRGRWPYVCEMNETLREIASVRANLGIASAAGLTLSPDGIHFSGPSYRELGRRYFTEFDRIIREER